MNQEAQEVAQTLLDTLPRMMRRLQLHLRRSPNWRPAHYGLLYVLARQPLNLSALAERHAVSLPTVSASISRLEARGWVVRQPAEADRRQVIIQITEAGREELARMQAEIVSFLEVPLASLTREELALVHQAILLLHRVFMEEAS